MQGPHSKAGTSVYRGAMEIAAHQGHIQHKLGSGGAFRKGIMYSKWPKCLIVYIHNQNNAI